MIKLRCQDCGRIQDGKKSDIENSECECGGSLAVMGSEDDEYEPVECPFCKREIKGEEDTFTCDECDEENICEKCIIQFESSGNNYCKECIDKAYPRKTENKVEYKEKVVEKVVYVDKEGTPLNTTFNPFDKTEFD